MRFREASVSYGGVWYVAVRDRVKTYMVMLKQTYLKATIFKRECKTTFIFLLWFKFYLPLFFGVLMYDNEFKRMGNKIWTKNKIEPQHYTPSISIITSKPANYCIRLICVTWLYRGLRCTTQIISLGFQVANFFIGAWVQVNFLSEVIILNLLVESLLNVKYFPEAPLLVLSNYVLNDYPNSSEYCTIWFEILVPGRCSPFLH